MTTETKKPTGSKCDGNCIEDYGTHSGEVVAVAVHDIDRHWYFNYCTNAINEDIRRGFLVEIL